MRNQFLALVKPGNSNLENLSPETPTSSGSIELSEWTTLLKIYKEDSLFDPLQVVSRERVR